MSATAFNKQNCYVTGICNMTADGILWEVPRLYQGIMYLQNLTWFYFRHANVIPLTSSLPCTKFHKFTCGQQCCVQISRTESHQNWTVDVQSVDTSLLFPSVNSASHCTNFCENQNSLTHFCGHLLYRILPKSKYTLNRRKTWLQSSIKAWLLLRCFHGTLSCLTTFCKQLLHQISWKYGKQF
jgi:hypothetical protein